MIRVGGALGSPHPILPAVPPAASALGGDRRPLYPIRYMWARARLGRPATERDADGAMGGLGALFPRLRRCPPVSVEQGGAKVESVARGFPDQRKRGRRARREAARQPVLLESEMRAKLLRQF